MDINLSVRATEELGPDERAQIVQLCVAAHNQEDFRNLFAYIAVGGRHFLARRGGELVSHAAVSTRWLRPGDQHRLRTAYVDAVATLPAEQGRGHASAVMSLLARSIDDYDIGCLETDRPAFYARLGWQEWRGPLAGLRDRELIPTPDQRGIMVLRLAGASDLDLDGALVIECDGARIW